MGTVENLQLLTKEDLLGLAVGDEIMIGHQRDPLVMEKSIYKVYEIHWWLFRKKIKIKFLYDSIDYKTNKSVIRKWNLVVGDNINHKGEQRIYTDSFKGRAGTRVFFKLNKQS